MNEVASTARPEAATLLTDTVGNVVDNPRIGRAMSMCLSLKSDRPGNARYCRKAGDFLHRSVRLWQVDLSACLNRMNDTIETCRIEGSIELDGENIARSYRCSAAARAGMVFRSRTPFQNQSMIMLPTVRASTVWREVAANWMILWRCRWNVRAFGMRSGPIVPVRHRAFRGQQQRLCIRAPSPSAPKSF